MRIINIYANFDILFLLNNIKTKYKELSFYEINILLYLSKLLSIYDGSNSSNWKYDFTNSESGAPISRDIFNEIENLYRAGKLEKIDQSYYKLVDINIISSKLELLLQQYTFKWRIKYIDCSITATLTKSIPQILNAIQNEPGIRYYKQLERSGVLHDESDKEIDELFNDFAVLKEVVGDSRNQILVPASVWIEYLSDCL